MYLDQGFFGHVQPSDETFQAKLWGPDYAPDYETDAGYRIIQAADGYWYYAQLDVYGEFEPSVYKVAIDSGNTVEVVV